MTRTVDDLFAAMKAVKVVKNKKAFSQYAGMSGNYYSEFMTNSARKQFAGVALVRIIKKLDDAGHNELAALAREVLFDDLRSRPVLKGTGE